MVDIKREDITLQDWTKGISADEFVWGSYFYSEAISSGYNSKGFELWYKLWKEVINRRKTGTIVSLAATNSNNYGFLTFTKDGRIETENFWNGASDAPWDWEWGGALYAFYAWWLWDSWYINWLTYWDWAIWIRQSAIDVVNYKQAFDPSAEVIWDTDMSSATWWTIWTWWTITDNWAEHSTGETWTLTYDISSWWFTTSDYLRVAVKITNWTNGSIHVDIGWGDATFNSWAEWWYVATLKGPTNTLTITPSSSFNGTIQYVNLHQYDVTDYVYTEKADLYGKTLAQRHPALIWEWDLYVACGYEVNIINLTDWWVIHKTLIDKNFEIVSMTQQAGNIILWATDWFDSRQYYWNGVDAVATEVIEWKGLIIQGVTGTETISYVLTTSWQNVGSVEWYEYRLYAVSWYQRSLIASKLYQNMSWDYLSSPHYNENKKFDFNDVTSDQSMTMFLDSLFIPGCDWIYKYGNDIPWMRSAWTRPIKYDTGAENITLWQRWHFLWVWYTVGGLNYLWVVDNRLYHSTWMLITESIYRDKLSTRKALEKLKIWYKNVASTVGNIKIYAIVDDTYFRRFRPTVTPTKRPSIWDVYNVANDTTAKVIDVDKDNNVITFATVSNTGSIPWFANQTLTKVSWEWDDSIAVGYNYDNMCLIKTIESEEQGYGSDLIFGKNFVSNYIPYRYKIQFVVELNSNNNNLSPEIYEISMVSDITDVIL